jgi:hypothetical protein
MGMGCRWRECRRTGVCKINLPVALRGSQTWKKTGFWTKIGMSSALDRFSTLQLLLRWHMAPTARISRESDNVKIGFSGIVCVSFFFFFFFALLLVAMWCPLLCWVVVVSGVGGPLCWAQVVMWTCWCWGVGAIFPENGTPMGLFWTVQYFGCTQTVLWPPAPPLVHVLGDATPTSQQHGMGVGAFPLMAHMHHIHTLSMSW